MFPWSQIISSTYPPPSTWALSKRGDSERWPRKRGGGGGGRKWDERRSKRMHCTKKRKRKFRWMFRVCTRKENFSRETYWNEGEGHFCKTCSSPPPLSTFVLLLNTRQENGALFSRFSKLYHCAEPGMGFGHS